MAGRCGGECIDPEVTGCQCGIAPTTNTLTFSGSGEAGDLFTGAVKVDPVATNALIAGSGLGLLVPPRKLTVILGGFISEVLPGSWTTASAAYVGWGGTGVTKKSFTKQGGASETDLLIAYSLTAYITSAGGDTSVFAIAVNVGGTDYDGSRWPISWPVDEITIGAALANLNDSFSDAQGDNTVVAPGASYSQAEEQEFRADAVRKINELVNRSNAIRTAVIGIGDNPWAHKSGWAAAGGISAGAKNVEIRAKKISGANDIGVDTRCDFSYMVFEVPAGATFHSS